MDVLELSLKFLFDGFVKLLSSRGASHVHDTKYVIIVPTHFNENMQEFITDAAVKVFIPTFIILNQLKCTLSQTFVYLNSYNAHQLKALLKSLY